MNIVTIDFDIIMGPSIGLYNNLINSNVTFNVEGTIATFNNKKRKGIIASRAAVNFSKYH